jgi:hypothetical protein
MGIPVVIGKRLKFHGKLLQKALTGGTNRYPSALAIVLRRAQQHRTGLGEYVPG